MTMALSLLLQAQNLTWQVSKTAYIDPILQMMTSLLLGHVINVYDFICTFTSPITIKLSKVENQHVLALPSRDVEVTTSRSCDQSL